MDALRGLHRPLQAMEYAFRRGEMGTVLFAMSRHVNEAHTAAKGLSCIWQRAKRGGASPTPVWRRTAPASVPAAPWLDCGATGCRRRPLTRCGRACRGVRGRHAGPRGRAPRRPGHTGVRQGAGGPVPGLWRHLGASQAPYVAWSGPPNPGSLSSPLLTRRPCPRCPVRGAKVFGRCGGVRAALDAMRLHPDSFHVTQLALWALHQLAAYRAWPRHRCFFSVAPCCATQGGMTVGLL